MGAKHNSFRLNLPRTLSGRLLIWGILLIVFPGLILLTTFFLGQIREERSRVMVEMEQQVSMREQLLRAWANQQSAQISSMAQSYDVRTHDTTAMEQNFRVALETQQQFYNIRYVNRNGIVEVDGVYAPGMDVRDREYFKRAKLGLDSAAELLVSRAGNLPRMVFSSPVYNLDGEFDGLIVGTVDMERVSSIINQFPLYETENSYMVNDRATQLFKTEARGIPGAAGQPEYFRISEDVHSFGIDNVLQGEDGVAVYSNDHGLKVIGAYRWLDNLNWGLICEIEEQQVLFPVALGILKLMLGLLAVFILGLPLAFIMVKSIKRPIDCLLQASEQLKSKNYGYRISEREISSVPLEFQQLCRLFNNLAGFLQNNQQEMETTIQARTNELRHEIHIREKAEVAMLHHEQEMITLLENTPDIISRLDRKLRFVYVNPAIYFHTGIPHNSFISKTSREMGMSEEYCEYWEQHLQEILATGKSEELIFEYETPQGRRAYHSRVEPEFAADGSVQFVLRITRDITDFRVMEKEMARFDRLDLVGEMAAGIGHEVRNPMTTVRGFLQMLERKNKDTRQTEYFKLMISELDRANSIITEFLSLAKNKAVYLQELKLDSVVKVLYPLMKADAMLKDKDVVVDLAPVPAILADEKEIRQLILNLVRNGLEAMPGRGRLTIRTFAEAEQVALAVQDEGTGIPAEVLDKLGTPFFTTKEQGTGLGLAVCYSIANRHGAVIETDTGPGGTTFTIRFPMNKTHSG